MTKDSIPEPEPADVHTAATATPAEASLLYRALFDQSPDGILIVDTHGRFIDFNEAAHRQLGYTREEFARLALSDIDPLVSAAQVRETIERALSGDRTEFDVVHRTKSGEERDVHVITQLLQLGGQPVFHTIWHDVTERTQAQRALQASEQFLQAIIETEPECVKLVARDGSLQFMNRAGLAMLGVDAFDQVRGQCMYPFVVPEHRDAFRAQVESVFGGRSSSLEFEVLGAKGNRLRLQSHATPLRTAGQEIRAMLAVTRDVTGQRKAEEELTRVQRLESLALLAGGVAHDFNNLLTVIMANLSLVMSALPRDGEAYRHLQEAETASQRTAELTRQLLTFAKGGAPIKATASLAEVLRESAGFAVRGSRVRCDLRVSTESSLVEMDAGQISQAINNLLINAAQAMPDGGVIQMGCESVTLDGSGTLPLPRGRYLRVTVADSGIGIPRVNLARIFDPYFTTKARGTGLGLATTHSIVGHHGGHVSVESQVGHGTTFQIYLPASSRTSAPPTPPAPVAPAGQGRVLVMDDEPAVGRVACSILNGLGYEADAVHGGDQAVVSLRAALAAGRPYALVILDLTIPGEAGGEVVLRRLRELDPQVKAMVSSGHAGGPVMAEFERFGFDGMVAKPYRMGDLAKAVGGLLHSARS